MPLIKNLLLVEDDLDDQVFFTEAISEIQNASLLDIASHGKEALDKLENARILPDLIFMDINMPVMSGIECLKEIRNKPKLKNIPVIILSTSVTEVPLLQRIGAKAFIKKPSDLETLRTQLEQIIGLDFITDRHIANQTFKIALSRM